MDFLYIKSIHIIFVVSWFAALFYIVRLFIYTTEAQQKSEIEKQILTPQLLLMQKKLWFIIGWPAAIGTYIFGWWMIALNPAYLQLQWMILKLLAVTLLTLYHIYCHVILTRQQKGIFTISSFRLRLWNELATIFLVAIVFLVVVKSTIGLVYGVGGLLIFALVLMTSVFMYRRMRNKK